MTTPNDPFEVLGALLRHDFELYECELPHAEQRGYDAALDAAFALAARRRFRPGSTTADITDFVTAARIEYDDTGEGIDEEAAGRVLRTVVLAEAGPAGNLDRQAVVRLKTLLLLPLLDDTRRWDRSMVDDFLMESRSLAAQRSTN